MTGWLEQKAAEAAFCILEAQRPRGLPGQPAASAWAWLGASELQRVCATLPQDIRVRYGLAEAGGCIATALAYSEGEALPPPWARGMTGPLAGLARFARANWYGEILAQLKALATQARLGLEKAGLDPGPLSAWRPLANSGLPERALALAAGLGSRGLNQLLITGRPGAPHPLGPGAVLGFLLLPFDPSLAGPSLALGRPQEGLGQGFLDPACPGCGACVRACPTGALDGKGGFDREACLQQWTTRTSPLPPRIEEAWGSRLYGCDACLEACPFFRSSPAHTDRGNLGPGLPASWLATASDKEIKTAFKATALGLGWMPLESWRRNARLSLKKAASFDDSLGKL